MQKTIRNFKDHVTPHQFQKGKAYYEGKKVSQLSNAVPGLWTAMVKGREPYLVKIKTDREDIEEVSCDCIAHTEDEYCKHVIATLIAITKLPKSVTRSKEALLTMEERTEIAKDKANKLLEKEKYREALDVIRDMIGLMPDVRHLRGEDPDYDLCEHVNAGFKLLLEFVQKPAPPEMLDRIFQRGLEAAMEKRYDLVHLNPQWIEVLVQMSDGKETPVIEVLDRLLKAPHIADLEWIVSRLLRHKTALLRKVGRGNEVHALLDLYPDANEFRVWLTRETMEAGNFAEARRLAEVGIRAAGPLHVSSSVFFTLRVEIADRSGDIEDIRAMATKAFNERPTIEGYRKLKSTYDPAVWPGVCKEQIIDHLFIRNSGKFYTATLLYMVSTSTLLAQICKEENDWLTLVQYLQKYHILSLAEEHADILSRLYPQELLEIFYHGVTKYVANNKHADAITETARLLKLMKKWKGGKAVVAKLVDECRSKYPSRTKLMAALNKIAA